MDALTVLQDARALLNRPWGFHRGDMARNRTVNGEQIECYCAVGAVRKAFHGDPYSSNYGLIGPAYADAIGALANAVNPGSTGGEWRITSYNDNHKKADVLRLFDKAIANLKENS